MNISKDEARILADGLEDSKYLICEKMGDKEKALKVIGVLNGLQKRLEEFGDDKRRRGHSTKDSFMDMIIRYCGIK